MILKHFFNEAIFLKKKAALGFAQKTESFGGKRSIRTHKRPENRFRTLKKKRRNLKTAECPRILERISIHEKIRHRFSVFYHVGNHAIFVRHMGAFVKRRPYGAGVTFPS